MTEQYNEQWILVVDDDDFFRSLVADILTSHGHSVLGARNAQEATKALASKHPVLVIVDYRLPDIDGVSWLTTIREAHNDVPVVFLSGTFLDRFTFNKLRNILKVSLILQKPIVPELFIEQLEGLLPKASKRPPAAPAMAPARRQQTDGVEEYRSQSGSLSAELDEMEVALAEAKRQCALELPNMVSGLAEAIRTAKERGNDKALLHIAANIGHRIKGTAGSCGFSRVAEDAARIERLLIDLEPTDSTMQEIIWSEIIRHLADAEASAAEQAEAAGLGELGEAAATRVKRRSAHAVLVVSNSDDLIDACMQVDLNIAETIMAGTLKEALITLKTQPFDALIIDQNTCSEEDVLDFTRSMRLATGKEVLPTALVCNQNPLFGPGEFLYLGCSLLIRRPVQARAFNIDVQQLIAHYVPCLPRILTVDDDPLLSSLINRTLSKEGMIVHELNDPIMILETVREFRPDIVLLDVIMPGLSGYDICRLLRQDEEWRNLIIMFLTSKSDAEGRNAAFQAGGNDFLAKPVVTSEVINRVKAQIGWSQSIRQRIDRDPVSGLLQRESLETALSKMVDSASTDRHPLCVCIIEPRYADWQSGGPPYRSQSNSVAVSEKVLNALGALLQVRFRSEDVRGRLSMPGSAEIILVLIEGQKLETVDMAVQLLRAEFENVIRDTYGDSLTASFAYGIAELFKDSDDYSQVLQIALERLRGVESAV